MIPSDEVVEAVARAQSAAEDAFDLDPLRDGEDYDAWRVRRQMEIASAAITAYHKAGLGVASAVKPPHPSRASSKKWCERCGGEGRLFTSRYGGNDPDVWPIGECPVCEGSGYVLPEKERGGVASPQTEPHPSPLIARLRELLEKATPGPWNAADWTQDDGPDHFTIEATKPGGDPSIWPNGLAKIRVAETHDGERPREDAAFIAAARNELPALLDLLEAQAGGGWRPAAGVAAAIRALKPQKDAT